MTQDEARTTIIREWSALPADERKTEQQAAQFALKIQDQYQFRCAGDRYQVIKGWLIRQLDVSRSST